MTAPITDIQKEDFGPSVDVYNKVQTRCFLHIKRNLIALLYKSCKNI